MSLSFLTEREAIQLAKHESLVTGEAERARNVRAKAAAARLQAERIRGTPKRGVRLSASAPTTRFVPASPCNPLAPPPLSPARTPRRAVHFVPAVPRTPLAPPPLSPANTPPTPTNAKEAREMERIQITPAEAESMKMAAKLFAKEVKAVKEEERMVRHRQAREKEIKKKEEVRRREETYRVVEKEAHRARKEAEVRTRAESSRYRPIEEEARRAKKEADDRWEQEEKARVKRCERARQEAAKRQKEQEKADRYAMAEWEDICKASIESLKTDEARRRRIVALSAIQREIFSDREFRQQEARDEAMRRAMEVRDVRKENREIVAGRQARELEKGYWYPTSWAYPEGWEGWSKKEKVRWLEQRLERDERDHQQTRGMK